MKNNSHYHNLLLCSTLILSLSGCGQDNNQTAITPNLLHGVVLGSYISGATVCYDNGQNECANNKPTTLTDVNGEFSIPDESTNILVKIPLTAVEHNAKGDTGKPIIRPTVFRAPASGLLPKEAGGVFSVSSITTAIMLESETDNIALVDAANKFAKAAGVTINQLLGDFNIDADTSKKIRSVSTKISERMATAKDIGKIKEGEKVTSKDILSAGETWEALIEQAAAQPISAPPQQPPSSSVSPQQPPSSNVSPQQPTPSNVSPQQPPSSSVSQQQPPSSNASPQQPPSSSVSQQQPPSSSVSPQQPPSSNVSQHQPPSSNVSQHQPPSSNVSQQQPPSSSMSQQQPPSSSVSQQQPPSSSVSQQQPPSSSVSQQQPTESNVVDLYFGSPNKKQITARPYISMKFCKHGDHTKCVVIDKIVLDTGSVGLRLKSDAITQKAKVDKIFDLVTVGETKSGTARDGSSITINANDSLANCYTYGSAEYAWGQVRKSDLSLNGNWATNLSLVILDDTDGGLPRSASTCANRGNNNLTSDVFFEKGVFNGIVGISNLYEYDCGTDCVDWKSTTGRYSACPKSTADCVPVAAPLSNQVANPISKLDITVSGYIIEMNDVEPNPQKVYAGSSEIATSGKLILGIDTKENNRIDLNTPVIPVDNSGSGFSVTHSQKTTGGVIFDTGTQYNKFPISDLNSNDVHLCGYNFGKTICPGSLRDYPAKLASDVPPSPDKIPAPYTISLDIKTSNTPLRADILSGFMPSYWGYIGRYAYKAYLEDGNDIIFGIPFFYGRRIFFILKDRVANGNKNGTLTPIVGPWWSVVSLGN